MKVAYMLKTVNEDMTAYHDFKWPKRGKVEAPDWDPEPICGGGLHGLLDGEGDGTLLNWSSKAKWLVVKIDQDEAIEIAGKVKVPRGSVVHCGNQVSATQYLQKRGLTGAIVGAMVVRGDRGTATAGYSGTATAGYSGTATAGYSGIATAGDSGTATAGYSGIATAGYSGIATAGGGGTISLKWWDGRRSRIEVFYVGEEGIRLNTPYRCIDGKAVEVEE